MKKFVYIEYYYVLVYHSGNTFVPLTEWICGCGMSMCPSVCSDVIAFLSLINAKLNILLLTHFNLRSGLTKAI